MVAEVGFEAGTEGGAAAVDCASGEDRKPTTRAPRAPTTAQIIRMIRALVAGRLEQMTETPMADGLEEQKLLEIISRTTAKLEDLARSRRVTGKAPRRSSKALLELRKQIADRIEQLNQG